MKAGTCGAMKRRPMPERGRDEDRAARVLGDIHHGGLGLVDRLQHLAGAVVEDAAVLGRLQAAGGAVEQAHAKVLFQFGDSGRGDGGRGALIAGGGGLMLPNS